MSPLGLSIIVVLLVLSTIAIGVATRDNLVPRPRLLVTIVPGTITNLGHGMIQGTFRVANAGASAAILFPMCSAEPRSSQIIHDWKGTLLPERLLPGKACTAPFFLPCLDERQWRVGIWGKAVCPAWKDTLRNWLIKFGLRERQPTAVLEYSQWFTTNVPADHGP